MYSNLRVCLVLSVLITSNQFKTFKVLLVKYGKSTEFHILTDIFFYGEITLVKFKQKDMKTFLTPLMVTLGLLN